MPIILAENEEYFNNRDHGLKAYERAKGLKKLVTIPGIKHDGIYGEARPQAQKLAIEWFDEHLMSLVSTLIDIDDLTASFLAPSGASS